MSGQCRESGGNRGRGGRKDRSGREWWQKRRLRTGVRKKERWLVEDTDGVCLVLVYFKNTVGNKANKHCGEAGRYRQSKCGQAYMDIFYLR